VFPSCIGFSIKRILRFLYWLLNLYGRVQVTNSKAIMLDSVLLAWRFEKFGWLARLFTFLLLLLLYTVCQDVQTIQGYFLCSLFSTFKLSSSEQENQTDKSSGYKRKLKDKQEHHELKVSALNSGIIRQQMHLLVSDLSHDY